MTSNPVESEPDYPDVIKFLRQRDYSFVRELGGGSTSITLLLLDPDIKQQFACKKYVPDDPRRLAELFEAFVSEIKILHGLSHRNIVKVFNYYLYRPQYTGYLLMEFIDGSDLQTYSERRPQDVENLFLQAVEGFSYLEQERVLHRDVRPSNLLVTADGTLKIIDFGFGKVVRTPADYDKSISLSWPVEPPMEFQDGTYDGRTEVYFVGKVFQQIVADLGLGEFRYLDLVRRMCGRDPGKRLAAFSDVKIELSKSQLDLAFDDREIAAYRAFASQLSRLITKVERAAKYASSEDVLPMLEVVYRKNMLDEVVGNPVEVARAFIKGGYYFQKSNAPQVSVLKSFVDLLTAATVDKRSVILDNVRSRLDGLPRYDDTPTSGMDDDIPF